MTPNHDLIDAIRARGGRLTRQRQLVLEILEENLEHLDVESVYTYVKKRDPRIGIATVYRTLALLKELGLGTNSALEKATACSRPLKMTGRITTSPA